MSNKQVVRDYLDAVEKGDPKRIRSLLSSDSHFGRAKLAPDDFVKSMLIEGPWKGLHVVKEVHEGDHVALVYEATNATTGSPLEATEFLTIKNGHIHEVRGIVVGGSFTGRPAASFAIHSVVMPI